MSKSISHIPHLDTLRTFAALIVVCEHFLGDWSIAHMGVGRYGVDIFFTISGFLITSILLRQKEKKSATKKSTLVKNFFARRALRLFPVYYLLLIALLCLSIVTGIWIGNRQDMVYFYTYTPNILFYLKNYQSTLLNHTWSLGIEEQFYLIWPWLIIFSPRSFIAWIVYGFTAIGFFSRAVLPQLIPGMGDVNFLPIGNFHTLGIGAILAYWVVFEKTSILAFLQKWNYLIIPISVLAFAYCYTIAADHIFWHDLTLTVATGSLVYQAYIGYTGVVKTIFDIPFLQYLGKISYGIYLYHKPIPLLLKLPLSKIGVALPSFAGFGICLVLTILVAHFSWKLIEQPILKLKERFD